jgi:putative addiction module killer protein
MITLVRSETFDRWLNRLRDKTALVRILARLRNIGEGNFGDVKSVGEGVLEMRVHIGPGYRLYYTVRGGTIVFLLVGCNKSTQQIDIRRAQHMAQDIGNQESPCKKTLQ